MNFETEMYLLFQQSFESDRHCGDRLFDIFTRIYGIGVDNWQGMSCFIFMIQDFRYLHAQSVVNSASTNIYFCSVERQSEVFTGSNPMASPSESKLSASVGLTVTAPAVSFLIEAWIVSAERG